MLEALLRLCITTTVKLHKHYCFFTLQAKTLSAAQINILIMEAREHILRVPEFTHLEKKYHHCQKAPT